MVLYNKIGALKYLIDIGPEYINEWTEAGMYDILCEVINSEDSEFDQNYLDSLLKRASDN